MELKKYQQDVLRDIDDFIDKVERYPENIKEAFRSFWEDRNVNINTLNSQYLGPYKDTVSGVPKGDGKGTHRRRKNFYSLQCS